MARFVLVTCTAFAKGLINITIVIINLINLVFNINHSSENTMCLHNVNVDTMNQTCFFTNSKQTCFTCFSLVSTHYNNMQLQCKKLSSASEILRIKRR